MHLPPISFASACLYLAVASLLASCTPSNEGAVAEQALNGMANTSESEPLPGGERTFDILGLRLGMTPAEVASIMESINAVQFVEKRDSVSGTDIEFLAQQQWMRRLDDHPIRHSETFFVAYTSPPSDPIVINLVRNFLSTGSEPDDRWRDALHHRYGEPGYVLEEPGGSVMVWHDGPGIEQCGMAAVRLQAEVCKGTWLLMVLSDRNSFSGRILRPGQARLHDQVASMENAEQFRAYQAEMAAKAEQ